ncbi:hypothetical protein [Parasediminibacterium sp. JCM 36343]|uniref:hypothetical protein n=1 Tax=Parasediminibacterium sp. JCM 36343 TaxID=3374279 RepID=UPI00397BA473
MKLILKTIFVLSSLSIILAGCSKNNDTTNGDANTAIANSTTFSLTNRVLAAFVVDSSSIYNLPAGVLPSSFNKFRKQLTYDTLAKGNTIPSYKVGDTLTVLAYLKGDDYAISQRSINLRFFQPPTTFNKPTLLFPVAAAEDSIRGYIPKQSDLLDSVSAPIVISTVAPLTVNKIISESISGVNYNTYLVSYAYILPKALSGKLVSINLIVDKKLKPASDLGNINWIYAFKVK